MKRIFSLFVEIVFWLQLFIAPFGIGALVALFIYIKSERLLWLTIVVLVISLIAGIVYAEKIRRKHGASNYISKRLGTPDIWPDEYSSKKNKKTKDAKK